MIELLSKDILIIGAGRSGRAAQKLLKEHKIKTIIFDDYLDGLQPEVAMKDLSAVILSPGIDRSHRLIKDALVQGIPVLNELDLATLFMPQKKMIGITGTNGKSTTTVMLESMLKASGRKAVSIGNLGTPLCEILPLQEEIEYFLVEISSFQLETLFLLKLDAAIILNITPNHLDRYQSFADYKDAKLKIISLLKPHGQLFINQNLSPIAFENTSYFSLADTGFDQLKSLTWGEHNQENAIAAFHAAKFLGLSDEEIFSGLKSFKALPHRCEHLGVHHGIAYINDSKGTTVVSVMKALSMVKSPVHLLLGGIDKGEDFSALSIKNFPHIQGYYIYGQSRHKIACDISSPMASIHADLKSALALAQNKAQAGDTILLSPGCASYDQFDNFGHRGDVFKKIVLMKEL